ncbi:MAG: hypothetical protein JJ863_36445 [Deltaproteobacteria bacterium]|nr:hypothetical protein [Deltaproteobacteria bacterium]
MTARCPSCKEILLTPIAGDLARCEACQYYVDPDGAVIGAREGRIRTALAEAGEEPRTVAELEAYLRRGAEGAEADELRELCERHRERARAQLDAVELPKWITLEQVGAEEGDYRDAGQRGVVRVTFANPSRGWSDEARMKARNVVLVMMVITFGSLLASTFVPSIRGQLYLAAALGGIVMVGALLILSKIRMPVRQLVLEHDRDEMEVHMLGGETVRVPVAATRLRRTDVTKEDGGAYLYLRGPGLAVRLAPVARTHRAAGRLEAARLEDVLRLTGPAPAEKKS